MRSQKRLGAGVRRAFSAPARPRWIGGILCAAAIAFLAARFAVPALTTTAAPARKAAANPWTQSQVIQPGDLAARIAHPQGSAKPVIVCAGFHTLYEGAHIPGAYFEGPASSKSGLERLKKWASPLPRTTEIIIYCGCCPLDHCPNVRPAFAALQSMDFRRLRVLSLPQDFATDWVAKGYPTAKGARRN
ncbi:MAG TPA: hypothetical protein VN661_02010 [Candidatus Acidoferrales bacterium]|nr:hypothetical protein [Candidatus Acidoferrales bacterium]